MLVNTRVYSFILLNTHEYSRLTKACAKWYDTFKGGGVMLWVIIGVGAVDITGRVLTLLYMMRHSAVRTLTYRTWVLLAGFLNFAFIAYWLFGYQKEDANV